MSISLTKEAALLFLRQHQPLPDDSVLDEPTLACYDACRRYFLVHPDTECIPLFLNSFGNGNGFGVYQLVEDVIVRFDKNVVLPHLIAALQNGSRDVRYWCAQVAESFPDSAVVAPLAALLSEDDVDMRFAAVNALSWTGIPEADLVLKKALKDEQEPELREAIMCALEE